MSKFTPGPWSFKSNGGVAGSAGQTVAFLNGEPDEIDCNGALISAAPELLECCKDLYDYLNGKCDVDTKSLKLKLKAAIMKAESC